LNWALRKVLGEHVNQAGSVVAPDRLRFDFTHNQAVTPEQLQQAETLVNQRILDDSPVSVHVLPLTQARSIKGVRAMFGEKYPDPVRVVCVGTTDPPAEVDLECSVEFCGGTHLERTGQVGLFKIVSEESVAKGTRRVTALSGREAVAHVQRADAVLRSAALALRIRPEELPDRIAAMQKELKELRKRPAGGAGGPGAPGFQDAAGFQTPAGKVVVGRCGAADPAEMRTICDQQRQKGAVAVFVGGAAEDKVTLIAMVDEALAKTGKLKAGDWVKAIAPVVGGAGGGKPTLAQAGGKETERLDEALLKAAEFAKEKLL
jgi:alanyl-tRNA synthetase